MSSKESPHSCGTKKAADRRRSKFFWYAFDSLIVAILFYQQMLNISDLANMAYTKTRKNETKPPKDLQSACTPVSLNNA